MLGGKLAATALGVVQIALVTRFLGKAQFGLFVLITSAAMTVQQLLSIRVWEWITVQFVGPYEARDATHAGAAVRAGLALSGTLSAASLAILAGLAPWIADEFLDGRVSVGVVALYGAVFAANWSHDTCQSVLRIANQFPFLATQNVVAAFTRCAVLGGLAVGFGTLEAIIAGQVAIEVVMGAWMLWRASRAYTTHFGEPWWRRHEHSPSIWRSVRDNRNLLLAGSLLDTLKLLTGRTDILILGWFRTPDEVGLYQAAYKFADMVMQLAGPVTQVAFAEVARLTAVGESDAVIRFIKRTAALGLAAALMAGVVFSVGSDILVWAVYGKEYADSADLLKVLAWSQFWLVGIALQPAFASVRKLHWGLTMYALLNTAKLGLVLWFVPIQGALGLAVADVVYKAMVPVVFPCYLRRIRGALDSQAVAQNASSHDQPPVAPSPASRGQHGA